MRVNNRCMLLGERGHGPALIYLATYCIISFYASKISTVDTTVVAKTEVVVGWVARVSQVMTSGHQTLQKHVRKKTVGSALISAYFEI